VINVQGKDQDRGGSFHFLGNKYKWHAVCVFFIKKNKHGQPTTCWPGVGPGTFIVFFSLLMIFFAS
jgi:hypothetical protein